jgi:hypothetical protein
MTRQCTVCGSHKTKDLSWYDVKKNAIKCSTCYQRLRRKGLPKPKKKKLRIFQFEDA